VSVADRPPSGTASAASTGPDTPTGQAKLPEWAAGSTRRRGLEGCLALVAEAVSAASALGIDTTAADAVLVHAGERLGFPADVYVLAFVGGTGVGKSSLLNALAGESVSAASVRRPTTAEPVAWVPASERQELAGLLAWLGVSRIQEHASPSHGPVAILDLPDMDSVEPGHRDKVEAILPRVDAVAWVTDPEKYHDAVLHDDFLRRWMPRLDHQAIVLNKSDRLAVDDAKRIQQLVLEHLGAAAIVGQGRQRTNGELLAHVDAEVSFQTPDRDSGTPYCCSMRVSSAACCCIIFCALPIRC